MSFNVLFGLRGLGKFVLQKDKSNTFLVGLVLWNISPCRLCKILVKSTHKHTQTRRLGL